MPAGAFNSSFEPVARVGDVINAQPRGYYQVQRLGLQPGLQSSTITVAANSIEQVELRDIRQDDGYLAQFRQPRLANELPDGVEVRVDHDGQQAPAFEAKASRGFYDNETGAVYSYDPNAGNVTQDNHLDLFTELFVYEDDVPYFTVKNTTGSQITYTPTFTGYQFAIEEIAERQADQVAGQAVAVPTKSITNF